MTAGPQGPRTPPVGVQRCSESTRQLSYQQTAILTAHSGLLAYSVKSLAF